MYIDYGIVRLPVWFVNDEHALNEDEGFVHFIKQNSKRLVGDVQIVNSSHILLEYDYQTPSECFDDDIDTLIELSEEYNG